MKTRNSIDLEKETGMCASDNMKTCRALVRYSEECGTCVCPFYKPKECKDWIRIEDEDGINLIPPEEYRKACKIDEPATSGHQTWKITARRRA